MGLSIHKTLFLLLISQTIIGCSISTVAPLSQHNIPEDFVDVGEYIKEVVIDARYFGENNFTGNNVNGYLANKCYLRKEAVLSLEKIQAELRERNMRLKMYDCYRPQRAVDQFILWTKNTKDQATKEVYYPNINKADLLGPYIASKSGHSKGNTLDLTILLFDGENFEELDMGSKYDLFDPKSHTITELITEKQQKNRLILKEIMEQNNFQNYDMEWWHYSFISSKEYEYLDFLVE